MPGVRVAWYTGTLFAGYLLMLTAGIWIWRLLRHDLLDDVFNDENESFMQETRLLSDEYSVNLPTLFRYRGQNFRGWVNIAVFRSCMVVGSPGSGKSFTVINNYIKQLIEKGYSLYLYDFKYPDLSMLAYNHLLRFTHKYEVKPQFCVINFDDPRHSHRCNPINADFLTDIADAYEAAYVIMIGLNRSWAQKQGDFFVESRRAAHGDYLVSAYLSEREILHLPPRNRTAEQEIRGGFHHPHGPARTGKLFECVRRCLAGRRTGAVTGTNRVREDPAVTDYLARALLGHVGRRLFPRPEQSPSPENPLRGQQPRPPEYLFGGIEPLQLAHRENHKPQGKTQMRRRDRRAADHFLQRSGQPHSHGPKQPRSRMSGDAGLFPTYTRLRRTRKQSHTEYRRKRYCRAGRRRHGPHPLRTLRKNRAAAAVAQYQP